MILNCEKKLSFPELQNCYSKGSLTVYRDILESRQVGKTFKLVNPKHEDRASVRNDSCRS